MTVGDTAKIMEIITVAYPRFYAGADKDKSLKLWAALFSDDNPHEVAVAVKAFITSDTSGYPPTIGQIKSLMVETALSSLPSAFEAWQHIKRAIDPDNGQGFDKLSDLEKRVVGSPYQLRAWSWLETSELETVVASNVQKAYRELVERERQQMMLPANIKTEIENISKQKLLEE